MVGGDKVTHTSVAAASPETQSTRDIAVLPRSVSVRSVRAAGYNGECHPGSAGALQACR